MACRWTEKARSKDDNQSITSVSGFPSKGASSRVGREVNIAQYCRFIGDVIEWIWIEFRDGNSECCNDLIDDYES